MAAIGSSSGASSSSSSSSSAHYAAISMKRLSPPFPMTELKLEINGLTGPQLNRLRHALYKSPSASFVDVTIFANDTGVSDQVHSHQLVLVPVYLDPAFVLAWHDRNRTVAETDDNTLVFTVTVDCPLPTRMAAADTTVGYEHDMEAAALGAVGAAAPNAAIDHEVHVFARDLRFNPVGKQADEWISHPQYAPSIVPVMVLHPDMHLMTLKSRGRRSFHAEVKAAMGTVDENTRFTDVLNCYFRPLPTITIERPITGNDARVLLHLCKKNVFGFSAVADDADEDDEPTTEWEKQARLESETYFAAYQNELSYSVMNTLVPTLRDGFGSEAACGAAAPLRVVLPANCDLCMACKNANLADVEDLTQPPKPTLLDTLTISIPATRYLFFLRCNAKRPAIDLLRRVLADMQDAKNVHSTDPVWAQLARAMI